MLQQMNQGNINLHAVATKSYAQSKTIEHRRAARDFPLPNNQIERKGAALVSSSSEARD
jgi:hypothetical protein